jgi:hypothetical protein
LKGFAVKSKKLFNPSQFKMEAKFRANDIVYERINPFRKMVVKHFTNGLYYCHFPESIKRLFVYFERELMGPAIAKDK